MKIQVLGSGCPTCKKLYEITKKAVAELGDDFELEYLTGVEGTQRIIELGAMSSPVLVVEDKIAMIGLTSDIEKIKEAIHKATSSK
ncbi:MAG: thioredoxin family protein [Candidatus Pacebacteria bacterium CG10_big_fil_rev_8_21_14_0_10_42_12]|nr:MAG: thioredoxin family protein [Candidatus Pacebacteria bacterium CG10_big_fil_rev_8_21_14_0_10_42_12]